AGVRDHLRSGQFAYRPLCARPLSLPHRGRRVRLQQDYQCGRCGRGAGIPRDSIVPVYQAFGAGNWSDDGGGQYTLPTPSQEEQILAVWAPLVPNPVFDYAYSWGTQNADQALEDSPALQAVFSAHNTYVAGARRD